MNIINMNEELEIIKSGDLVSIQTDGYRFSFDKIYKYKKSKGNFDYLLCKLKDYKGFNLYLHDKGSDEVSFLGYLTSGVNNYHTSLLRIYSRIEVIYL
jgi:hypothetical protein